MWGQIIAAVAPTLINTLVSGAGAKKAQQTTSGTKGRVAADFKEWKDSLGQYQNLSNKMFGQADDLMDPLSGINQAQRKNIRQAGMDYVAQSNLLNQRNLSSGGMGGFSGIAKQNLAADTQKAYATGEDAFSQALQSKHHSMNL